MKAKVLLAALGLAALVVYWLTLAPSITWRNHGVDSGELAAAVAVGGVPHPPGFPTYLLLGDIFARLPVGDVAYRLNLLSAGSAALTVAVVGLLLFRLLPPADDSRLAPICAATAALLLAFAPLFWSQAVITEVYAVSTLAAALLLGLALLISPDNQRWLLPVWAAGLGLGLGTHLSIILFLPAALLALNIRWRGPGLVTAAFALAGGLAVYLIIPWRASAAPPINWGAATSRDNLLWLVSAQIYRPYLFAAPVSTMWARAGSSLSLLGGALGGWGVPLALLGLSRLWQVERRLAVGTVIALALLAGFAVGYNTTDSAVYLLPALLIMTVWLGWGLFDLGQAVTQRVNLPVSWAMLALPLLALALNFSAQNLSDDTAALEFAHDKLAAAPAGASLLVEGDAPTFALWYGRYGLKLRPDTAVVNPDLLAFEWYRANLHRNHPHLVLTDPAGNPTRTLTEFARWNRPITLIQLGGDELAAK